MSHKVHVKCNKEECCGMCVMSVYVCVRVLRATVDMNFRGTKKNVLM